MFTVAVKKEDKKTKETTYVCSKCKSELGLVPIDRCPNCKRRIVIWG